MLFASSPGAKRLLVQRRDQRKVCRDQNAQELILSHPAEQPTGRRARPGLIIDSCSSRALGLIGLPSILARLFSRPHLIVSHRSLQIWREIDTEFRRNSLVTQVEDCIVFLGE